MYSYLSSGDFYVREFPGRRSKEKSPPVSTIIRSLLRDWSLGFSRSVNWVLGIGNDPSIMDDSNGV